ncbi:hypothetical protein F4777DRAFT_598479 [Nemania sp. FL0916]|nr:hypothetical protein F4777DRAFT_598479 [Nemania sp. FL0916]
MGKLEKAQAMAGTEQSNGDVAPPSYNAAPAENMSPEELEQLNSAFASLQIPPVVRQITADTCLAHLKLLFAFQNLKEAVGYTDGLWEIHDSQAFANGGDAHALKNTEKIDDETQKKLSLLREKRWTLYVARAVRRYEVWWKSFSQDPLTEDDMQADSHKYSRFASHTPDVADFGWKSDMLPPLDVLMVWHAHMLNPRAYFEDCMRRGLRELWHSGLPWQLINDAIDTNFDYNVSMECKHTWKTTTQKKWDNADDALTKKLPPCPKCLKQNVVPWSTYGTTASSHGNDASITDHGYGDANFGSICATCGEILNRNFIEVHKFSTDVKNLLAHGYPMPGTLLDNRTGKAEQLPQDETARKRFQRTFPNRLIRYHLRSKLYDPQPASMEEVRKLFEEALGDFNVIKQVEGVGVLERTKGYRLGKEARVHVRKMMSNYWGNGSAFSLELGGAVTRQGIFTEKMYKIDWLHSPAARDTMSRLITKYERFTEIMGKHQLRVAVPTLDIDLAWHTHQLSPASYYEWMCSKTKRFIDHDDKIDETKLSTAFEWTSGVYQEMYGEVYSECTCWYCESIRTSHTSSVAEKIPIFKTEKGKASDRFHDSGRAALCPPDNSAHISAHNAVQVTDIDPIVSRVHLRLRLNNQKRLEDNYEKARKRAKKKGRELPPRGTYYDYYWGAPYLLYAPYVYLPYYPVVGVPVGTGYYGACANGSCGGGVASGACGGAAAGACAGGTGGAGGCGGGGGGCGGGGGGGCGGGGGGCGGGGGGGGCGGGGC